MDEKQLENVRRILIKRSVELQQKRAALGKKKNHISFATDLLLKMAAVMFDALGLLFALVPYIGGFIASGLSITANFTFILFYFLLGTRRMKGGAGKKTIIIRIICFLFELIPYVNVLPAFSISIWYTNSVVKKADKKHNDLLKKNLKEIEAEERALQVDIQQFTIAVQQLEESRYNKEQEELEQYAAAITEQNQIQDDEEYDRQLFG